MKIKIAMIEPVGGHGGMDYYDISLCSALSQNDIIPILFTCDKTNIDSICLNFKIIKSFTNIYGNDFKIIRGFKYFTSLLRTIIILKKENIKLTHLHFFHISITEFITVILLNIFGFKQIVTLHDISSFYGKNCKLFAEIIFKIIKTIIVHNKYSKNVINKYYANIKKEICIIPHGNYLKYVKYIPKSGVIDELNLDKRFKYLLFFGQIKQVKGLDVLIKSLPYVENNFVNYKLIIAGKTWKDDFKVYEKLIKKLNLDKQIINHIGFIPNDKVHYYFNASDIIILPYREIYQSGVLLMSLSYKKPVIVSNIDGMTEIITNEKNGMIFNNGDHKDLARCISILLKNDKLKNNISTNGHKKIIAEFDWSDIGKQTSTIYRKMQS